MAPAKLKPSGWCYVVAGAVLVAGIAGFILFLVGGLSDLSGGLTQMIVPGQHQITLSETGSHTVFHEHRSVVGDKVYSTGPGGISGLRCKLVSKADGREIPLHQGSVSTSYSMGSRSGVSIFDFSIDSPGEYVFSAQYPPGRDGPETVMAIGHGFVGQLLVTILGGIGIMFGSLGLAAAIAVVTFVKRRRSGRRPPEVPEASVYHGQTSPPGSAPDEV
ncbi:MAG: hypothetical protein QGG42_15255 [Phycisphaerae bacterium]|jgi:hypothetical protein|nr:hypothetical protein [Phycisphaerae bacterium]